MKALLALAVSALLPAFFHAQVSVHSLALAQHQLEKQASAEAFEDGRNCPVELAARRAPEGGLMQTRPEDGRPHLRLHLSFKAANPQGIAQADLVVHGMAGTQVMPAGGGSARHAQETFHISPSAGADHRFTSTVYLQRLTGVDYVELTEITFADGTQWHSSAASACRVAPNGFKLVASSK